MVIKIMQQEMLYITTVCFTSSMRILLQHLAKTGHLKFMLPETLSVTTANIMRL